MAGPVRMTARSPWGPNRWRISTAFVSVAPDQCRSPVSNSATSPGRECELAFAEDEAECAGEDGEPFMAGVGDELRLSRREDLLEDLDPARVPGQGNHNAAASAVRLQMHAGVTGGGRRHQLVQRDTAIR
jgi:hypothetical protein